MVDIDRSRDVIQRLGKIKKNNSVRKKHERGGQWCLCVLMQGSYLDCISPHAEVDLLTLSVVND